MTVPAQALPATVPRWREYAVAAQLVVAAGVMLLALRRTPLPELVAAARAGRGRLGGRLPLGASGLTAIRRHRLAARAAGFWRGRQACLLRSVLLLWLESEGPTTQGLELVVGIPRRRDGDFAAHAWIERDRVPLGESVSVPVDYAELARL